jgi:predicted ATPase/DNA-binding SARP family transcriptional activator
MTMTLPLAATRHEIAPPLRIALLGPPQLAARGAPLGLPRRQLRALLYRLAVALRPVPRDQICLLLWPDAPDSAARRNLTVLLNQLRQALPAPEAVRAQSDSVALDPAHVWCDTVAFAAALAAAQAGDLAPLAAAVEGYAGPFLDGFALPANAEFDDWLAQERQHWERRYLDALAALADGYAAAGAYAPAIAAAQRALAVDELAEEMHRRLIALYAAQGDRAAAQRQFERCALVLERELGVEPLPETRAAYEAALAGRRGDARQGDKATRDKETSNADISVSEARFSRSPGLPASSLPASQSPDLSLSGLPAPSAPLIGRVDEVALMRALLADQGPRLLTLTGPGGSGKSRLALEAAWAVAGRFADGAAFVALAPLRDAALVTQAIAQACGLAHAGPGALADHLRDKRLLLVLDNCEHLPGVDLEIAALLAAAPGLRVLATSRSPLAVHGEHAFPVPPLPLPDLAQLAPPAELAAVPSVALLLVRARAVNPRFQLTDDNAAALAAICVRLDGLPLAIELAAARLRLLAPGDLLRRLQRRLSLLTGGPRDLPARQQTLHAAIDWSYRLLGPAERRWFERCSAFVGSWSLEAAEALEARLRTRPAPPEGELGALDGLGALAEQSLVQIHYADDGGVRFSMLETIREFAAERLQAQGGAELAAQAHAAVFAELLDSSDANAPNWIVALEPDHDNLRAMLRWQFEHAADGETLLRLGAKLGLFWYRRADHGEGRWWMERVLARTRDQRSEARARMLYRAALFSGTLGDMPRALALHEAHLDLSRALGLLSHQCASLGALGILLCRQGELARSVAVLEEGLALARELGQPHTIEGALGTLASVLTAAGQDLERAVALRVEGIALAHAAGRPFSAAMSLAGLGLAHALMGDSASATAELDRAIAEQRAMKSSMDLVWVLQWRAIAALLAGEHASAREHYAASLQDALTAGGINSVPCSLDGLAGIAALRRQPTLAARLMGAAEALRESIGIIVQPAEQPMRARALSAAEARLPAHELRAAWQAGRGLSAKQAIAEAVAFARCVDEQPPSHKSEA